MNEVFMIAVLVVALSSSGTIDGANILVMVPTPAFSHQQFYRVYLNELHKRGHNLTVVTPNPINDSSLINYREIDLSYGYQLLGNAMNTTGHSTLAKMSGEIYILFYFLFAAKFVGDFCEETLSNQNLMDLYRNKEEFDLVILEWGLYNCFNPFEKLSKGKFIGLGSYEFGFLTHVALGNPTNPACVRDISLDFREKMNFWERLKTTIFYSFSLAFFNLIRWNEYNIAKKYFGSDSDSVYDASQRVALVMDNSHWTMSYPRPTGVNYVPLGGGAFHLKGRKANKLPKDIQDFLDGAEHGVIYFSFGTNVKTSSGFEKEERIIIESFGRVKQRILWKWENENVQANLDHVKISKWLPQVEILAHPNVKAFVTQGGLQSIGEAIEFQVPMIVIPFFADQGHNAAKLESVGAAIVLHLRYLNVEDLTQAFKDIIHKKVYKENVVKFHKLVKDQPMDPLKKAVWWTEYVIRHDGAPHLRSIAATMPWYQYYMIDIFCAFILVIFFLIYVVRLLFGVLRLIFAERNGSKKRQRGKI